ncbi:MAG: thiamine phosphate synthase [Dehalococcoidia bacterium]|nr:thiamine phosphate synthase [Dehalococcoidia bacterium]MSQ16326.1 thiamine phosphate synthase [Dehalococcoidia bacterium]
MPLCLPQPCLCLVTDRRIAVGPELVRRVAEAVAGGVDLVQLRDKELPGGKLLLLAQELQHAISISGQALLVINERADVAAACDADGVQLGEDALLVAAARRVLGSGKLIGRSVHSLEGAIQAAAQGADFLVVGAMYATTSHPGLPPAGPELVRRIARSCPLPIIGIGGIHTCNAAEVVQSGACGVAVITSILAAPQPREAARRQKQSLLEAWSRTGRAAAAKND